MTETHRRYRGFADKNGPVPVRTAYFDGYDVGERQLEGVPIEVFVSDSGRLMIGFFDKDNDYVKGLNQSHWLDVISHELETPEECEYAFYSHPDCCGDELMLVTMGGVGDGPPLKSGRPVEMSNSDWLQMKLGIARDVQSVFAGVASEPPKPDLEDRLARIEAAIVELQKLVHSRKDLP